MSKFGSQIIGLTIGITSGYILQLYTRRYVWAQQYQISRTLNSIAPQHIPSNGFGPYVSIDSLNVISQDSVNTLPIERIDFPQLFGWAREDLVRKWNRSVIAAHDIVSQQLFSQSNPSLSSFESSPSSSPSSTTQITTITTTTTMQQQASM